jgi:sugar phosphate isomerase/epimerase
MAVHMYLGTRRSIPPGHRPLAFCERRGVVDLPALVDVLVAADYDGLAIIELDMSEKPAEQHDREHRGVRTHRAFFSPRRGKTAS